jgi:hypothetical protein
MDLPRPGAERHQSQRTCQCARTRKQMRSQRSHPDVYLPRDRGQVRFGFGSQRSVELWQACRGWKEVVRIISEQPDCLDTCRTAPRHKILPTHESCAG